MKKISFEDQKSENQTSVKTDSPQSASLTNQPGNPSDKNPANPTPDKKKPSPKFKKKPLLIGLVVFFLLFLSLGAFTAWTAFGIKNDLTSLGQKGTTVSAAFQAQDFEKGFNELATIKEDLVQVETKYRRLSFFKAIPFLRGYYLDGSHLLGAANHLLAAAEITSEALVPYYDLLGFEDQEESAEGEEEKEAKEETPMTVEERLIMVLDTLDAIQPQFDQISQKLNEAKAEVDQIKPNRYPEQILGKKVRKRVVEVITLVDSTAQVVDEIRPIISYLKPLLGIPDEKSYFLLFQNDKELRPSGGFITAYAFLSIHNGKFQPGTSYDIYNLDARFGNRIKAPEPILEYLPNVSYWHLRDMNLSPDFAESMKFFWENYRKIPGTQPVDAIIAVDTQILVDILEVLGPIGVSGWGNFSAEEDERCDCPQVVYELEKYADQPASGFREGRKGIIGPLMHSILANIMGSPRKKWPEFINIFLTSLKQKNTLLYFFDEELQGAIETLNAGGRIKDFDGDYFHLNDCNFGGAKSNMYIRENVVQEIQIAADGTVTKTVTIDYKNPAPPSDCNLERGQLCLNALYRDWFRLYVPQGSELIEATGSEVEIKTSEELGKTVFEGFYGFSPETSLKPEGKLRLTFKYKLPFKAEKDSPYRLLIQKQPGALPHDYEVKVNGQTEVFELNTDKELQFLL